MPLGLNRHLSMLLGRRRQSRQRRRRRQSCRSCRSRRCLRIRLNFLSCEKKEGNKFCC